MDQRLAHLLKRLGQADGALRDQGRNPEEFVLISAAGGEPLRVIHSAWDRSWMNPVATDIDDLEELGHVRIHPPGSATRKFGLTVRGRQQAELLSDPQTTSTSSAGGGVPLTMVLDWLIAQERTSAAFFDRPAALLDHAVQDGLAGSSGREGLATSVVLLIEEGYLSGDLPDFDQATNEQRVASAGRLRLTMKAYDRATQEQAGSPPPSINFYGSVVAGQIAAGDITNYVTFSQLLDRAEAELDHLDHVDDHVRDEARTLIEGLRGKALNASGVVVTGAGGQLLGSILGQLLGLGAQ